MATKLQKMRDIVRKFGAEYGWEWNQKTGLLYAPSNHNLDYYDSWNLQEDISNGNQNAKRVAEAIDYLGKYEIQQAQRTLKRRGTSKSQISELYRQNAVEILQSQRERISNSADFSSRILNLQNIYRESTDKAMRQTPRVRASVKGVQSRVARGRETLEKALSSDAVYARTSVLDPDSYESLRKAALKLGVNVDDIAEAYKQQLGDPYKALERAYIEAQEQVTERLNNMRGTEEYEEFMASSEAVDLLRVLGVDFT